MLKSNQISFNEKIYNFKIGALTRSSLIICVIGLAVGICYLKFDIIY